MAYEVNKDWTTKAGFRAVVIMVDLGHHCGYVGVPKGHPLHGVDYGQECAALKSAEGEAIGKRGVVTLFLAESMQSPDMVFDVHGSLTYSGGSEKYPVPSDGLWWFGYDCGHCDDAPSDERREKRISETPANLHWMYQRSYHGTFRDLDYCIAECESLAKQIVEKTIVAQE